MKVTIEGEPKVNNMPKMNQPEREQTTIRLPAELKEKLQREADRIGISLNALILRVLNEERNSQR